MKSWEILDHCQISRQFYNYEMVCVYLPSVHLPPPILYHLPPLFCVFCHAIFSTLAIRTSATPILKSESMQSIQQVGRRGHEGDDG